VCAGTNLELTDRWGNNVTKGYEWYRNHYENCTDVETNLEIVHLNPSDGSSLNLSFFENIREVCDSRQSFIKTFKMFADQLLHIRSHVRPASIGLNVLPVLSLF
jgi:hypothetical protein